MTAEPTLQWTSPSPLWPELIQGAGGMVDPAFLSPTILRFATDSFMDEFMGLLNTAPGRLGERRVMSETWREPIPLSAPVPEPPLPAPQLGRILVRSSIFGAASTAPALKGSATDSLKLYQAAHQRFYLVSACLVCKMPGLPDRVLNIPAQEQASFVMRRLKPHDAGSTTVMNPSDPGSYDEFAFVPGPQEGTWQQVSGDSIKSGEELLPLFPTTFTGEDGRKRRLLSGLIPVGKRESYLAAPLLTQASNGGTTTPPQLPLLGLRETLLNMQVVQPWNSLDSDLFKDPAQSNQVQMHSWYILLDLAGYMQHYLLAIWKVLAGQQDNTLNIAEQTLLTKLNTTIESTSGLSLAQALVKIAMDTNRNKLEQALDPYTPGSNDWPDFSYNLADPTLFALVKQPDDLTEAQSQLEKLVYAALPPDPSGAVLPSVGQPKPEDKGNPTWFVIRCVFERPNCGPLKPTVVSPSTQPFKLAAFFDPDAPGRPIRISLPLDTSIAGLRKFNKNVAFVISNQLRKQMASIPNLKALTNGSINPPSGGLSFGLICSFSIPIITICAFIILFIFLILLNIIFFWLPLFEICFPLPGLNSKGE